MNDPEQGAQTANSGGDVSQILDVSGESCPMPLLRTKLALNQLGAGEVLRVIATDPRSERDFETFCAQSGTALLQAERKGDTFVYLLQKAAS
ncbi:MAG: sulfurtransferase TusA family protein [Pseudomonadota bacterium]